MSIELKNISKQIGAETHIYPTSIKFEANGFNILLGTTLSGKTTLLRLIAGLEKPSSGEVWFKGKNVTGVSVQKRNLSMVYQQFINYPNMTVFENIASPLRVAGIAKLSIQAQVEEIAELLKLAPMLQRMPHELSGGQQQRTAMARALVKKSELVLLDEPLANLDYKLREELRQELPKLFRDSNTTVVYATTEPSEALLFGGYTAALQQGRVIQYGQTAEVYRKPIDIISAQVFSEPPLNTATIKKQGAEFVLSDSVKWDVAKPYQGLKDGAYTLGFRPHHITMGRKDKSSLSVNGRVAITEISGSESVVHLNVDNDVWVSLSQGIHPLEVGDWVEMFIQTKNCFLFDQQSQLICEFNS